MIEKQSVAQERVRLNKDTHTDQEQVSEQVRKEQVETDGDTTPSADRAICDAASSAWSPSIRARCRSMSAQAIAATAATVLTKARIRYPFMLRS